MSSMAPLRRALVALGIAGILLGIATFVMVAKGEAAEVPLLEATLTLLIGWSLPVVWRWPVMPAWFLSEFKVADIPFAAAIGFAANSLPIAILIHLLIVFPSGRARGRLDRFFIGYAYVAGGLVAAIPTLFYNPGADPDCTGCVTSKLGWGPQLPGMM